MRSDQTTVLENFYLSKFPEITERLKNEMSPGYTYHCVEHVLDVIEAAENIAMAEHTDAYTLYVVKIACLYHDIGFIYQRKDHEQKSAEIFRTDALAEGLNDSVIIDIEGCILATQIPQAPLNEMEQIVCDADLDYLGRTDYDRIADTLFKEMQFAGELSDPEKWKQIQINFLRNHKYHTRFSINLRMQGLLKNLEKLQS